MEKTLIRVGNEEYARENHSYGLTTMRNRHAEIKVSTITFKFQGKSGIRHTIDINDRRLARIIQRCQDIPGYELFQYIDNDGEHRTIDSASVRSGGLGKRKQPKSIVNQVLNEQKAGLRDERRHSRRLQSGQLPET